MILYLDCGVAGWIVYSLSGRRCLVVLQLVIGALGPFEMVSKRLKTGGG
jgi:hypothetical protein